MERRREDLQEQMRQMNGHHMKKTRTVIIGAGGIARHHMRQMLKQQDTTEIVGLCEPSPDQMKETNKVFAEVGLTPPPNEPDITTLFRKVKPDSAFICSPHSSHFSQTKACMEAGLDVLLEKPMVLNAKEAVDLIAVRDKTRKLLVVAFPGSLSPQIRAADKILRSGEIGRILSISAVVWQGWGPCTVNTWRQKPEISGGGFLFDTGAHMLNTVVDLAGEGFAEVAAWMDNNGRPVETEGVVIGRLASGALVTLHACGETIPVCSSDVHVFCADGILRTGIWGGTLEIQKKGEKVFSPVPTPPSLGVWQQFIAVRKGDMQNPCPPEVGLRMAKLYDAIKSSATHNGAPTRC